MTTPERIWHERVQAIPDVEYHVTALEPFVGGTEYTRADLHDATKEQLEKSWQTCLAATNRGMIAERKLAKAVEALRAADSYLAKGHDKMAHNITRSVLAEIEKGRV